MFSLKILASEMECKWQRFGNKMLMKALRHKEG
jgi:hypothetical protein